MSGVQRAEGARRLFFALWPDEALRAAAASRVAALVPRGSGRPQRPDQLHVTLVFLGAVDEAQLTEVEKVGEGVTSTPFVVVFDRLEHWRKPRVLCLGASAVPPALVALVEGLRDALATRHLPTETRPFRPHLTLARKLARLETTPDLEPLLWQAESITLVESVSDAEGSRYEPLASWPLGLPMR